MTDTIPQDTDLPDEAIERAARAAIQDMRNAYESNEPYRGPCIYSEDDRQIIEIDGHIDMRRLVRVIAASLDDDEHDTGLEVPRPSQVLIGRKDDNGPDANIGGLLEIEALQEGRRSFRVRCWKIAGDDGQNAIHAAALCREARNVRIALPGQNIDMRAKVSLSGEGLSPHEVWVKFALESAPVVSVPAGE